MGKRQRKWAATSRAKIFDDLGRICIDCGATEELEFDIIIPIDNTHHEKEWSWRMSFYRAQHRAKNLAIRCRVCNGKKQNQFLLNADLQPDDPF